MGIVDYSQTIDTTNPLVVDPDNLLSDYVVDGKLNVALDCIFINGIKFKGVSRDSTLGWEEFVWSQEPTRSNAFAFENMDTIDVGLVAQCQVNFKYFNIQDFMRFREAIKQRYFNVIFFNVDTSQWTKREMYCSKSQRDKLYYFNPKLVGILDFVVNLVATNRDVVENLPSIIAISLTANGQTVHHEVPYSEQFTLEEPPQKQGFKFEYWTTELNAQGESIGWKYDAGQSFTVFKPVNLFAIYKEI